MTGYTKTVWQNAPSTATPLNADALNNLETQYDKAMTVVAGKANISVGNQFDDVVRAQLATNLGDASTVEGAELSATIAAGTVDNGKLSDPTSARAMHDAEMAGTRTMALTGHSLMYGQDTTASGTNPPVNGGGTTRSALPTPERFDLMTDYLSPGAVTVVNQSFPGDRSTEALTRWAAGTSGDIEFVWIDTNDGLSSVAGPALTDPQTAVNLRDFIKRARSRGADVVVVGGSPAPADSDTRKILASAQTDRTIGERMGAKYVDAGDLLSAVPRSLPLWSSGVHLQKEGYNIIGTRLAALTGPKGVNPPKIAPGRIITPRDGLHVLRGGAGAAVATVTGAADGTVWQLTGLGMSVAIPVEVTSPCIPLVRCIVQGATEGFGIAAVPYNTDGSGRSGRFINLAASATQASPAYAYFPATPMVSLGPDSVVVYCRSGNLEIDSIEFIPIPQGQYFPSDASFDQKRSKTLRLSPVGGASAGRANASWDFMCDIMSGVAVKTDGTGSTGVDTRWLFDLNLGPSNSGVTLAQSIYGAPSAQPYGVAQGYLFIRSGTSLIARKLDNGTPTDVTFTSAFASATGNVRCALEIYYSASASTITVYLDGVSLGTVSTLPWSSFMAGLIAGVAASGGYAAGSGTVVQKASAII